MWYFEERFRNEKLNSKITLFSYLNSWCLEQFLEEDATRNRMLESLLLFEAIINLRSFAKTPIILFLNKNDQFQVCFEEGGVVF